MPCWSRKRGQSQERFPTVFRWAKSPWRHPESIRLPWKLRRPSMKIPWNQGLFMDGRLSFQGRRIDSGSLQWAFCSANHGWKSFLTLTSFPAQIRDFKNLKGTWHQMLARSRQLQGIFGLLKPFLHVQILICFVDVYQNHGVHVLVSNRAKSKSWVLACRQG